MNAPPAIVELRISRPAQRPVHMWLPLFLLWPVGLALAVLGAVLTVIADIALLVSGRRYHHYTLLLIHGLIALSEARGVSVHVRDDEATVDLTVR